MNIIVCIKQVPDAKDVRLDPETNTLAREGVESIMNPYDQHALEEAVRIKEARGGEVTVITMGPPQAEEMSAAGHFLRRRPGSFWFPTGPLPGPIPGPPPIPLPRRYKRWATLIWSSAASRPLTAIPPRSGRGSPRAWISPM